MNRATLHTIDLLVDRLSEIGISVSTDDIHFSIMNAQEWIWIDSDLTGLKYPPHTQFGIYIDESGEVFSTATSLLGKFEQVKANKLIRLFKQAYMEIINDINDEVTLKEA